MSLGVVKCFRPEQGYGFIVDLATSHEVFVHHSGIRKQHEGVVYELFRGEYVQYTISESARGLVAQGVTGPLGGPLYCEMRSGVFPKGARYSGSAVTENPSAEATAE